MPETSSEAKDIYDRKIIFNVPNVLTMIRLLLVPVFAVLFLNGHRIAALFVYAAASLTDVADGYIARRWNMITDFGKLMDPLADKLMVVVLMVCMVVAGVLPPACVIVLVCKELLMVLGGMLMLRNGLVVFSKWIGKLAQLIIVIGLILCFFTAELEGAGLGGLHLTVLWTGIALALAALCYYAYFALKALKNKKNASAGTEGQ